MRIPSILGLGFLIPGVLVALVEPFPVGPEAVAEAGRQAEIACATKANFRARFDQKQAVAEFRSAVAAHPTCDGVDLTKAHFSEDWNWEMDCGACSLRAGDWYVDWTRYEEDGSIELFARYRNSDKVFTTDGDRRIIIKFAIIERSGQLCLSFSSISTIESDEVI